MFRRASSFAWISIHRASYSWLSDKSTCSGSAASSSIAFVLSAFAVILSAFADSKKFLAVSKSSFALLIFSTQAFPSWQILSNNSLWSASNFPLSTSYFSQCSFLSFSKHSIFLCFNSSGKSCPQVGQTSASEDSGSGSTYSGKVFASSVSTFFASSARSVLLLSTMRFNRSISSSAIFCFCIATWKSFSALSIRFWISRFCLTNPSLAIRIFSDCFIFSSMMFLDFSSSSVPAAVESSIFWSISAIFSLIAFRWSSMSETSISTISLLLSLINAEIWSRSLVISEIERLEVAFTSSSFFPSRTNFRSSSNPPASIRICSSVTLAIRERIKSNFSCFDSRKNAVGSVINMKFFSDTISAIRRLNSVSDISTLFHE